MTLAISASIIRAVAYPLFYFSFMRGTSPDLTGVVIQKTSQASENSGASLTLKRELLYVSSFVRFRYTRPLSGIQPRT
jgi:hypothetical protein